MCQQFILVRYKEVTPNCLAVRLKSDSNQESEIAFVHNPNEETEKNQESKESCQSFVRQCRL